MLLLLVVFLFVIGSVIGYSVAPGKCFPPNTFGLIYVVFGLLMDITWSDSNYEYVKMKILSWNVGGTGRRGLKVE